MNRAIFIIMIPALLVAAGYIFVLRYMGFAPGYTRLIIAMILFFGTIYWLSRRSGRKTNSNRAQITKSGTVPERRQPGPD